MFCSFGMGSCCNSISVSLLRFKESEIYSQIKSQQPILIVDTDQDDIVLFDCVVDDDSIFLFESLLNISV